MIQLLHLLLLGLLVLPFLFTLDLLTPLHVVFEHLANLILDKRAQIGSQLGMHNLLDLFGLLLT